VGILSWTPPEKSSYSYRDGGTKKISAMRCLNLRRALDGADAGYSSNAEDHAVEVVQVFGFYYKGYGGFAVIVAADIDVEDIGVVVGDYGG
jgi:hypothetical protein